MAEQGIPDAIARAMAKRPGALGMRPPRRGIWCQSHGTTRVIAQTAVDEKSNEFPAMYTLLDSLDLTGTLVTADVRHTQRELATYLVEDKHADDLLIAKGNQPTLQEDRRTLGREDFSPSGQNLG